MKTKKLKSLTVIPNELYVERKADKQLASIISNMGRPGYVLVSRQMGKTNLLLNAKRNLESEDDIFLYVDLSNPFSNIQEFFRSIINTIIDVHEEVLGSVKQQILKARADGGNLPAHKEHEQELRQILGAIRGKLVVCLDEIDALTNSDYSDGVFSQIRSIYFASRINFEEFNRLTYILSGVAEPNEIIKNKNISPFNIGEKIYLDDFSRSEFQHFLYKAELELETECAERIFYWTSGNPRLCWDLCSAIEEQLINGVLITSKVIDLEVRRLYLTEFDLAPVDHIRKLVEDDKDIRNAVMSIHYKKFSSINENLRNKLYLVGIVNSDFSSSAIKIKNRIIEESLSEEWIEYIEGTKLSYIEIADKKSDEGLYAEALDAYKNYEATSVTIKELPILFFKMGRCYFNLKMYDGAIEYLTKKPVKKSTSSSLFYTQHLLLGTSYYRLGRIEESIACYEKIVESNFIDEDLSMTYFEACINLSAAYFENVTIYSEKILDMSSRILENKELILQISESPHNAKTVIVVAYHNQALVHKQFLRIDLATKAWQLALEIADLPAIPKLYLELLNVVSLIEKKVILRQFSIILKNEQLNLVDSNIENPFCFTTKVFAEIIAVAYDLDDVISQKVFFRYLRSKQHPNVIWNIFRHSGVFAAQQMNLRATDELFGEALRIAPDIAPSEEKIHLLRYLLARGNPQKIKGIEEEYLQIQYGAGEREITEKDIPITFRILNRFIEKNRRTAVRQLINVIRSEVNVNNLTLTFPSQDVSISFKMMLDYTDLKLLMLDQKYLEAKEKALHIKNIFFKEENQTSVFDKRVLDSILADAEYVLDNQFIEITTIKNKHQYGRNEKLKVQYKNGVIKFDKYKLLQKDIESGICIIIPQN
ncbi:AAA-like domain-containing protein [Undibacterium sp. Ji83W]|uniref:tetratricopeptide repeat protein n=1 Tax=Undibacterium sp. Ji83W TaxID=3413043 RepID=UPI003BEFC74A